MIKLLEIQKPHMTFSEEPHSRKFTVTSEDGQWKPVYTVNVVLAELPTSFNFEKLLPYQ